MNRLKLVIVALLLAVLLHPFSTVAAAEPPAAGDVHYYRRALPDPVMNKAIIDTALNKFVYANNDSVFNIASDFVRSRSSGSAENPDRLHFDTTFRHKNDSNTYDVEYAYRIPLELNSALNKGDLQVSLTANLTNDKHWNIERHRSNWSAYPEIWLQTWTKTLLRYDTDAYNSDTTKTVGKHTFAPVPTDPWANWLLFGAVGQVCTCGNSKVSNISIILADTVGPRVTSIVANRKAADGKLQPYNGFRPGQTVYITMQFNESIRFAGDSAMSIADAPKLKLELRGAADNVLKAIPAEASLISLDDDMLTFVYQVPDNYQVPEGTVSVNHYVSAIAPYLEQESWNRSEPVFDLKLFGQSGYLNYPSKTTSLIVDLAGNPLDIGNSVRNLQSAVNLDGTLPTVKAIRVAGMAGAVGNEASVDQVFARVGDYLGFFVDFSEDLAFVRKSDGELVYPDSGYLQDERVLVGAKYLGLIGSAEIELLAELNVTTGDKPVTAIARYATSVRNKNGGTFWRVYFSTPQPTGYGMAPLVYGGGDTLPIGVNRIFMSDRFYSSHYALTDCRGNPYDESTTFINTASSRLLPAEQLWLDFSKPGATTSLTASGGLYKPLTYGVETGATAFCFPIAAADVEVAHEKYASGTNGVTGYFMWRDVQDLPPPYVDKYPFEYAVTSSAEQPPDSAYRAAMTYGKYPFTQVDDVGNYIHIRFIDGVDYNFSTSQLVVYPKDNANNQGEASFQLDFTMDHRKPQVTQTRSSTQCYGTNQGWIYTTIRFTDVSAMASAEYQWTPGGAAPGDTWVPVTNYGTGTYGRYRTMSFSLERGSLQSGIYHSYSLYVRGTDAVGHQSDTVRYDFKLDLRYPSFGQEFATNPGQPNGQHSLLISAGSGDNQAKMVWVMVKQPLQNHPQYQNIVWYWRKVVNVSALGGGAVDVLAIDESGSGWEECEVWLNWEMWRDDPNIRPWKPCTIYTGRGLNNREQFLQHMKRYGPLEIEIIARPNWKYYLEDLIFYDENYSRTTHVLNYASDRSIGSTGVINLVAISPQPTVSPTGYGAWGDVLVGSPDDLAMPRSLDGAVFNVALSNARYAAYGLGDIDFESDQTLFSLYETGEGAAADPVFSCKLAAKASQQITIPAGVATRGGSYRVVVTLKAKGSAHVDRKEYADILIDRRQLTSYGVARVTTSQALGGAEVPAVAVTDYTVGEDERASAIYVSASPDVEQTVLFTTQESPLIIGGAAHSATYLQVWNETAVDQLGEGLEHPWIRLPAERAYRTVLLTDANKAGILANLSSGSAAEAAVIPILPGENVIKYRLALAGGYQTPEQTLLIQAGLGQPVIRMQLTPDLEGGLTTNGNLTARVALLESPLVDPDTLQLGVLGEAELTAALQEQGQVTLLENGQYCFYAYDKYHNFGYHELNVDCIDRTAPALSALTGSMLGPSNFQLTLQLDDDHGADGCQLFLQYDAEYSAVLGVETTTVYAVPLIDGWVAGEPSTSGLFAVSVADVTAGTKAVTIRGSFKYDRRTDAPAEAERHILLYVVDVAGNRSGVQTEVDGVPTWTCEEISLIVQNLPTSHVSGDLLDGSFAATFSRPVHLSKPGTGGVASAYTLTKRNLPFFANGKYLVEGVDIFGDQYSEEITVTQYDALYACSVSFSELAPTNQNVRVVLNAAFNLDASLILPESVAGGTVNPVTNANGSVVGAEIVMSKNGTISYQVKPNDGAFPAQSFSVAVQNIDKIAPEVALDWVYTADVADGQTAGEVIVSLSANEELQALDGSGTTHLFTLDDQQPHLFRFADLAGNEGSVTAVLPVAIVQKGAAAGDTAAPDYDLAVYRSEGGVSNKVAGYTRADYEAIADGAMADAFPLFAGVLQLRFQIYDASQTALYVEGVPDGSTAVAVSGNTVTVRDNLNFSVVLSDSAGNKTTVPVQIAYADNTAPRGTVTYVRTAPFVIRGYLEMTDEGGRPVTLKNGSGVMIETTPDGPRYFHEFRDNESFTFVFADAAGNLGSTVAVVSSLDMNPPSGRVAQWVPHYVDSAGVAHPGLLSERPTNSDVSVYLQFDRAINSLVSEVVSGNETDIALSQTEDSATVVFRQNAKVKLTATGLNGRSSSLSLTVDIIDKLAPVISASQTGSTPKTAIYTFTSDEPVIFEQADEVTQVGTSFQKSFDLNGEYALRFIDLAGNTTVRQITVSSIDRIPPSLTVNGLPAQDAALRNQAVAFTASMNEQGSISFRGVSYPVSAWQSQTLTVDYNGTYEIVATDRAGLITSYSFTVSCIDRVPPQLILPAEAFLIRQGATVEEVETRVKSLVHVSDNHQGTIEVFVFGVYERDLGDPGELVFQVLAQDAAGNQTIVPAKLRIYPRDELQIKVNNLPARRNGTMFVSGKGSRLVTVSVENLPTGVDEQKEPYRLYWRKGLRTEGQMKYGTLFDGSFTAAEDGFYTIYAVTQSRASFLTYIYIEQ